MQIFPRFICHRHNGNNCFFFFAGSRNPTSSLGLKVEAFVGSQIVSKRLKIIKLKEAETNMKVTQKHRMIMFLPSHTHTHTHTHTQRHLLLSAGWFHSLSLKTFSIWWENDNTQGVLGNGLLSYISQNLVNKYHSLGSPETLREQICHMYTFSSASAAHSETQAKLIK